MTEFESFQNKLLKKLGYDVAPFDGDYDSKFVSLEDGKFHFMDGDAEDSYRELDNIKSDILLRLDDDGYHVCPFMSEDGEPIKYSPNLYKYFILRKDDKYTELEYLDDMYLSVDDTFEVVDTDDYITIKYNKHRVDEPMRLKEKPLLDSIIAKEKDIAHLGVFVYYFEDKIIVYSATDDDEDEDEMKLIVYDKGFNVLYRRQFSYADSENFIIWEVKGDSYLIFPYGSVVYKLSEAKAIRLPFEESRYRFSAMTYKDIFILYTQHRYPVDKSSYDDDYSDWDYDDENSPIKNTEGCVYDLNFKLLRKFNVLGEIVGITEFGNTKVMEVEDSDYNTLKTKYYNINGDIITHYIEETKEEFSVPDITFTNMEGYDNQCLYIVRTKMYSPEIIIFGNDPNSSIVYKCGVYIGNGSRDSYAKIIDCKYDYIKSLPLKKDENVYYLGVVGNTLDNKYDLYINHKIVFQNYPFKRGRTINVVGNGYFIKYIDLDGKVGFIRNGEVVFKPLYQKVEVYVDKTYCELEDNNEIDFLYVVSDGERYGICSPSGDLILPLEYSIIDIDNSLTIILGKNIEELDIEENDDSIMWGDILMEVGSFSKETNSIFTEKAKVKNNVVQLDDRGDYVWDGDFKYTKEYYNPWSRENYSHEEAMYDALGGEMEAIWNLD